MAARFPQELSVTYYFNQHLMYLIQNASKRPSAEIVNFFHELACQIYDIGLKKRTGRSIHRKITDYFPNTNIPFYLVIKGHIYSNAHIDRFICSVEVTFPTDNCMMPSMKEEELRQIAVGLMEKTLLGGDDVNMPDFVQPEVHTPKVYKAIMKAFTGKKD